MKRKQLIVREVVKTLELDSIPFPSEGGGDLHLRVEIVKDGGRPARYFSRVWKLEFYRLQPSFPQRNGKPKLGKVDEQVLVPFDTVVGTAEGASISKVLRDVLNRVQQRLM